MGHPRIILATLNLATGTTTLVRSDGKEAVFDTGFVRPDSSRIARLQYSPGVSAVLVTTTLGDSVAVPLADEGDLAPVDDRPVVYLDQNHWSTLSKVARGSARVKRPEMEAARRLIYWAEQRRIILPVSSGHCVETTEWPDAEARYHLGLTLERLSAGWVMRHPLDIENAELTHSLGNTLGQRRETPTVFTQEPGAMHDASSRSDYEPGSDFPDDHRFALQAMIEAAVKFDLLTDGDVIERRRLNKWRLAQQEFSDRLDQEGGTSHQKRQAVMAFFMADIRHMMATAATHAAISTQEFYDWLNGDFVKQLIAVPYLGLRHEFLTQKHLNRATTWQDSDLIDMMYLCLGGAYADLVVCEASAASHVRQAQRRLGREQNAVSRLSEAVGWLTQHSSIERDPPLR